MLKTIVYILIPVLLVVGVAFYFTKNNKKEDKIEVAKVDNILLYPEQGEVLFKTPSDKNFQKATTSPTLIPNLTIVHTSNGKATVLFEDNSNISIDKNTEITINYTKEKIDIFQSIGTTYHRVEKLVLGSTYEVRTPSTLAAVRGTKFAVSYEPQSKNTKVSVTEHQVEVMDLISKDNATTTSTDKKEDRSKAVMVKENQMIIMQEEKSDNSTNETKENKQSIRIINTKDDIRMNKWIEENKNNDIKIEKMRPTSKDKESMREEVKSIILEKTDTTKFKIIEIERLENKTEEQDNRKVEAIKENTDTLKETVTPTTSTLPKITTVTPINTATTTPKVALTEEQFFTQFDDLFIKYFYLDDIDTPCNSRLTPEERVKAVNNFASENGRTFSKSTLLSFGQSIATYCTRKDAKTKLDLQARFDDEYPFR